VGKSEREDGIGNRKNETELPTFTFFRPAHQLRREYRLRWITCTTYLIKYIIFTTKFLHLYRIINRIEHFILFFCSKSIQIPLNCFQKLNEQGKSKKSTNRSS